MLQSQCSIRITDLSTVLQASKSLSRSAFLKLLDEAGFVLTRAESFWRISHPQFPLPNYPASYVNQCLDIMTTWLFATPRELQNFAHRSDQYPIRQQVNYSSYHELIRGLNLSVEEGLIHSFIMDVCSTSNNSFVNSLIELIQKKCWLLITDLDAVVKHFTGDFLPLLLDGAFSCKVSFQRSFLLTHPRFPSDASCDFSKVLSTNPTLVTNIPELWYEAVLGYSFLNQA